MTRAHAKIHIGESEDSSYPYYWTVEVLEVVCTKPWSAYKTSSSAKRTAIRWCHRLGLTIHTVTFDNGVER